MVRLFVGKDLLETQYVRSLLECHGIEATVLGELLGAARGELPLTQETLPGIYVHEKDVEQAMQIVDDYVSSGDRYEEGLKQAWACPTCGEAIGGQFTQCWSCQTPRPAAQGVR